MASSFSIMGWFSMSPALLEWNTGRIADPHLCGFLLGIFACGAGLSH
jgi:hypothetical protein